MIGIEQWHTVDWVDTFCSQPVQLISGVHGPDWDIFRQVTGSSYLYQSSAESCCRIDMRGFVQHWIPLNSKARLVRGFTEMQPFL